MLDIRLIRMHPEMISDLCARRGCTVDVDRLIAVDREFRQLTGELGVLQHERKNLGKTPDRGHALELKERIAVMEEMLRRLQSERDAMMELLPNLLAADTPEGADDRDNVELARWGELPQFDFTPKSHEVVGAELDILDLERGTAVAGTGFYFWKGDGARLAWAVFSLALEVLIRQGFTSMFTPIVAKPRTLFGTGFLPFFNEQISIAWLKMIYASSAPQSKRWWGITWTRYSLPARCRCAIAPSPRACARKPGRMARRRAGHFACTSSIRWSRSSSAARMRANNGMNSVCTTRRR